MAEVAEKHPSLPANYVSLVQLQGRWLEEQQRKQREKEEERKQRENEEEELKRVKKEKNTASSSVSNNPPPFRRNWNGGESYSGTVQSKKQIGNGERKTASSSVSNNRRSFYHNRKPEELQIENVREKVEEESGENQKQIVNGVSNNRLSSNRKLEESTSENVRVQDEQIDGKSKKKKKRMTNGWKPKVQENLTGGNELEEKNPVAVSEGKEVKKKIPVVVSEGDDKMAEVRVEYRPKRPVNQTAEIGRKFDDLSLKEGNVRSQRGYNRDSGRFGRPRMEKLREGGQMWVIKGERIDTDAAGAGNQAQVD